MVTRRLAWSLFLLALLLSFPVFVVEAKEPCSTATLNGTYGISIQFTVIAQLPHLPAPPFPAVESGIATFDGAGNVSVAYTLSLDGVVVPGSGTGTYTVNPDCTYSDEVATSSGSTVHHAGSITGLALVQQVNFIYTDAWLIGGGTFKKILPSGCSLATLKGTYGALEQGTIVAQLPGFPPPPVPFAISGIVTFDGAGNLSGVATASFGGATMSGPFKGTYTVNPDCTDSDEFTTSFGVFHHAGTITGWAGGILGEVQYIYTDPGVVASGTLKKRWP